MAQSQWRRFQFFDKGWITAGKVAKPLGEALKVGDSGNSRIPNPTIESDAAAYLPPKSEQRGRHNSGYLFFGDENGIIHVTDEDCQPLYKFIAFGGKVQSLRIVYSSGIIGIGLPILICLGLRDPPGHHSQIIDCYEIKFFNCESIMTTLMANDMFSNQAQKLEPSRIQTLPLAPSTKGSQSESHHPTITTFAASSNGNLIAVGFSNGSILLLRSEDPISPTCKNKGYLTIFAPDPYSATHNRKKDASNQSIQKSFVSGLIFGERKLSSSDQQQGMKHRNSKLMNKASRLFVTTNGGAGDSAGASDGSASGSGVVCCFDVSNALAISSSGVEGGNQIAMVSLDDDNGCAPNCCAHNPNDHQILVARTDAVYSFTCEDRAGAAGFEGEKQALCCLAGHLPDAPGFVIVASHNSKSSRTEVNVYDLANKFVAFNHRLDPKQLVTGVLSGTSTAYFLVSSPSTGLCVIRIKERDTAAKLEVLLKMNYYQHAIMLAKQARYSPNEVNTMVLMFADHKYKKCDWEGAIAQYCHTIGYTEPSYVIRKFLDAQRISNLTTYLEKLHLADSGAHSTKDHTALLLNCYTKLKSASKLDSFVSGKVTMGSNFDVEAAMDCLRSAGYRSHALSLIKQHKHKHQHEWVVELLLEEEAEVKKVKAREQENNSVFGGKKGGANHGKSEEEEVGFVYAKEALEYMRGLPQESVEFLLAKFGRLLILYLPDQVTELVGDLCTGVYQPIGGAFAAAIAASAVAEAAAQADIDAASNTSTMNSITKRASILAKKTKPPPASGDVNVKTDEANPANGRKSNPDAFMNLFVDDSQNLKVFLQRVVDQVTEGGGGAGSSNTISQGAADTLIELLLQDWTDTILPTSGKGQGVPSGTDPAVLAARKSEKAARVMAVLQNFKLVPYDKFHALVLVQVHGFKEGQHLLLERLSRGVEGTDGGVVTEMLVDYYFECTQIEDVLKVCKRESNAEARPNPPLWSKVLTALVLRCQLSTVELFEIGLPGGGTIKLCHDEDELEEAYDLLIDFLTEIERDKILPPFQVMQLLSLNANLPLSVAINFLSKFMKDAVNTIDDHQQQIDELRTKTANISESIGDMGTMSTRKPSSSVGSGVYTEANKWEEMKRSMNKGASDNEARFAELQRSRDGFSTIAKFFGEGMIR